MNSGSGFVRVCDSAVAGGAVVPVGPGDGVAGAVVVGGGEAVGVAVTDAVDAGAGSARAGDSVTAVSEARVTTNAASSAVVFRIEFTFCLS